MKQKLNVLLVEDDPEDAEMNVNHLIRAGYDVTYTRVETADGMNKALEDLKWDLILSDYSMPKFDVPSALEIFHQYPLDIPFIVVSGAIGEEIAVRMIKAGAHDYLLKDNMIRFASVVERELREAANRRDLVKANTALKASEEKYRNYVEHAPDGVFVADETGRYVEVNKAASLITGYSDTELLNMTISDLLPPDDQEWGHNHFKTLQAKGFASGEGIFTPNDGTRRWWSMDTVKLSDTRFLGFTKDITSRKTSELEVIKANKQLELLNQYLVDAREDERKLISLEIHDELGQALTAIKFDMNWLRGNIHDTSGCIERLNKMLEICNEIIKNVQRISSELRPGLLDDLGLVSTIDWYCSEFEGRTGIKCNLDIEELPFEDTGLSLALFRILQEALTNVIRHSKASYVNISLHYSEPLLTMIIEDNGTGFPSEKVEAGTSLGLAGMRERARQSGANIEFVTKEGKGTKLIITFTRKEKQML
jgi:two-component system, NarL family, sensor histidine kinase UhpB